MVCGASRFRNDGEISNNNNIKQSQKKSTKVMSSEPEECPVCLSEYDLISYSPMVAPCGHSYCQHCTESLFLQRRVRCPLCNAALLSALRSNFAMISLLEKNLRNPRPLVGNYSYDEVLAAKETGTVLGKFIDFYTLLVFITLNQIAFMT